MSQFELGCSGKEGHRHNVVQPRNRFRHALAWKPWLPHHTRRMWRHSRRKVDSELVDQRAHGNISGHPQCLQLKSVRIPGERGELRTVPSKETEKLVNFPLAFPSYFDYSLAGSELQHKDVRKYKLDKDRGRSPVQQKAAIFSNSYDCIPFRDVTMVRPLTWKIGLDRATHCLRWAGFEANWRPSWKDQQS